MCIVDWSYQGLVDTDSIMLAPKVRPNVHTKEYRPRSRDLLVHRGPPERA